MDGFWHELLNPILSQNNPAIMAILLIGVIALGYLSYKRDDEYKRERRELVEKFQAQTERDRNDLLQIIDKYQEGQLNVVQAMNEIKVLIATIGAKL